MLKLKDIKEAVKVLGSDSLVGVTSAGKYEKEYLVKNSESKAYEVRFATQVIKVEQVLSVLENLGLNTIHDLRIKSGFKDGSVLVEL